MMFINDNATSNLFRLKDISIIMTGNTPSKEKVEYYGGKHNFYKPSDMVGDVLYSSEDSLTDLGALYGREAPTGSTLVCCIGATLGKAIYLGKTGCFNQQINAVIPSNRVNSKYLYFQLITTRFQDELKSNASYTTLPIINANKFSLLTIYLPPLEEQRAIAEYLDRETVRIDRIVELLTKQRERYAQLKRSLISEVVTHGLPHHNPANYRTLRLKDICIINPSYTGNLSDNEQVSFFPMENIKQGYFINDQNRLLSEVKGKYTYCANGDIVMAKITPSFENGNIALLNGLTNGIGFGSSELIPFRPSTMVDPTYLLYFLQTDQFKNKAIRTIKGVGGLRRIDIDDLKVFPISLPPLEEQQEIVAYLDERCKRLDRLVEAIDRKIDLLGSLKKSLIEEVVTGQRRITN